MKRAKSVPVVPRWPQPLGDAIEVLFAAFAHYPLKPHLDNCLHCTDERDNQVLHAAPLRDLSAEQLGDYAFCAMTTMGDASDYRHFLPRVLELSLSQNSAPGLEPWLITSKLNDKGFGTLPPREFEALAQFNRALWSVLLAMSPADSAGFVLPNAPVNPWAPAWNAEDVLRLAADVTKCLPQLLHAWRPLENKAHLWHFAEIVLHNHDTLGPADVPFDEMQNAQAREALRLWILDEPKVAALENAACDDSASPWAEPCNRAAMVLKSYLGTGPA
jgi:hypothetical protein